MKGRMTHGTTGASTVYDRFLRYDEPVKTVVIGDFSGGVCTGERTDGKGMLAALSGMQIENGALFSMAAPRVAVCTDGLNAGTITAHCYDEGVWLFRKGNTLYAERDGVFSRVGTAGMLTAEHTGIYAVGGEFFVISGEKVLRVTRALAVTEVDQYVPTFYKNVSPDGTDKTEAEPLNPFCRYIELVLSDEVSPLQTIPPELAVDDTDIQIWKSDGTLLPNINYVYENQTIRFLGYDARGYRVRLKLQDAGADGQISFATSAWMRHLAAASAVTVDAPAGRYHLTHGRDGGRVLAVWRLDGASDFAYLSEERLATVECGERITAVTAYSDGALVFSEHAVKKMTWAEEDGILRFSFQTFKQDFGSDMPGSVCGFDDKIVFASSRGGVYYINKFGITERDVSRHISVNIERGVQGFFSHTAEEYRTASAVCAFGRYYLTVGNMTYIWDYRAGLPSGTQSLADERRMVWTMTDAASSTVYGREILGRLYYTAGETGTLFYLTAAHAEGDAVPSSMKTAEWDMDNPKEKVMTGLSVRYRAAEAVTLAIWYDGMRSPCAYTLPPCERFTSLPIRIYPHRFVGCAVSLSCHGAMAVEAIVFSYV